MPLERVDWLPTIRPSSLTPTATTAWVAGSPNNSKPAVDALHTYPWSTAAWALNRSPTITAPVSLMPAGLGEEKDEPLGSPRSLEVVDPGAQVQNVPEFDMPATTMPFELMTSAWPLVMSPDTGGITVTVAEPIVQ